MWLKTLAEGLLEAVHEEAVRDGDHDGDGTQELIGFTGVTDHRFQVLQYQLTVLDTFSRLIDKLWLVLDLTDGTCWITNERDRIGPTRQLFDKELVK